MTLPVEITGRCTTSSKQNEASVTSAGELVVGSYSHDLTEFNELGTINVGVNFYQPVRKRRFVITGVVAAGNLSISASALATVIIYEASSETTATVDKSLIQFGITRLQTSALLPLNILVSEGKFVNAKTDDDDIFMTIMGFYIPA